MQIRVCDDEDEIANEITDNIKNVAPGDFDIGVVENSDNAISQLIKRKLAVASRENPLEIRSDFDGLDVLVVDYDLVHLHENEGRITGEGIAKLARAYSSCGAIVVLNQFKGPQFDLGMRGHLDSHADLNIDAKLIGSEAIWGGESAQGEFNPTIWRPLPGLCEAARALGDRIASEGLDSKLLPKIGLSDEAIAHLSDSAFGFLDPEAQTSGDLSALTVRRFLHRSLDSEAVEGMSETAEHVLINFTAFRVTKWLERAVLRPMEVIIDSLHLIDRLPFLINGNKVERANAGEWNEAAKYPQENLRWDVIGEYYNELASDTLGKHVFDWYALSNDPHIDNLHDEYLAEAVERFFLAEDTSRFVTKGDITRYRADFHNFGDRRGIERIESVTYGPQRRLSFS